MRRTKEEAEETRSRLLEVGVRVFNERGYADTRLEDIARAAGVTRGAIYHHFGNKVVLFKEIAIRNRKNTNALIEIIKEEEADNPINGIRKLLKELYRKLLKDSFFRDFEELAQKTSYVGDLLEIKELLSEEVNNGYNDIIKLLEDGKKAKKINKDINSEVYAMNMVFYIIGLMRVVIFEFKQLPVKKNLNDSIELLLKPLSP